MENISHSLSKRSSSGNGFAGKTVYDDVFGGPPKFEVPTLSPRFEDYNEIFDGFHASRPSSIPILDLPMLDDLSFDVRTSMFDYSQVFGGFNSLDFAVSYHELFNQSNSGDDSSNEAWTPAQSDSLSDESDPSACSEKNKRLSNRVHHQSIDRTTQFNISYHKANPKCKEDISNVMTHVTHFQAVPGFTFTVNEIPPSQKIEDENSHLQVTNDLNLSMDFGGAVTEGKQFRKTMSQPPNSNSGSLQNESFVSVSNISLRTQPSQLPPPSRPPPALAVKRGDSDRLNSKLKTSKSYAFERMVGESSPPYFDVEISASSSAVAMKNAVEKAQVKLSSAQELMERKEGLRSHSKLQLEREIKSKEGKTSEAIDRSIGFKDERVRGTCEIEGARIKPYDGEERQKVLKKTHVFSGSIEGEKHINVTGEFAERMHSKEHRSSQGSHKTEGTVEWREAAQFYEVVEKERAKDEKFLVQNSMFRECGEEKKVGVEEFEQQEYGRKIKLSREAFEWEENGHQLKVDKGVCEWDDNKERKISTKESHMQEEHQVKANVAQRVCERKENEKKLRVAQLHGDIEKRINEADKCEECENLIEDQLKKNEMEAIVKLKGANEKIENENRLEDAHERKENVRILKETFEREDYERIPKEAVDRAENEKRVKETLEQEAREEQQKEARESEENDKKQKEACERGDNEKKQKEAIEKGENEKSLEEAPKQEGYEMRSKEAFEQEESENRLRMGLDLEENKKKQKLVCEREQKEKRLTEARTQDENEKNLIEPVEQEENGKKPKRAYAGEEDGKRLNDVCEREKNENRLKESWEHEENNKILQEAHEREQSEKRAHVVFEKEGMKKGSKGASEWKETENRIKDAGNWEGLRGQNKDHEQTVREENERKLNLNQELYVCVEGQNFKVPDGACKLDDDKTPQAPRVAVKYDINSRKLEATQETLSCEEDRKFRTEPKDCEGEIEVVEWVNVLVEESINSSGMDQNDLLHENAKIRMGDATKSRQLHDSVAKSNGCGIGIGQTHFDNYKVASEMSSDTESTNMLLHKQGERGKNVKGVRFTFDQEGSKREFTPSPVVREWVEDGRKTGDARLAVLEVKGNLQNTVQKITSQSVEGEEKNLNEILSPEEREKEERLKRARELENDHLRKIEEEREREREREKDRMAVDRATREACERAFVESRERAARAAVERATAEVRQRALTEARERLEKASAEARERLLADRASMEARLRAERAAVERATAEAGERAVEKSKAEKSAFEARERVERSVADAFSASSRSGAMVQSFSSSDVQFQREGSSRGLRYLQSSVHGGVEGESAQRCKARLERHQRTAERAAKALAEKNMRDLLTQREQTERNRLAEVLDAEVKRWSSGKEGNLRALLSTLQYILGPDSGWQSIPLTDVITSVSVKKAYRKATLCVHPDKLQQRGASIQQKYICEKVFDLLKEAWNKFNSEER